MTNPALSTKRSSQLLSRGTASALLLVAGSTSLLLVSARYSADGPDLLNRSLQGLGIAAMLVGAAMFFLALFLQRQTRLAEVLRSRQGALGVAFAGKSTTLRRELGELSTSSETPALVAKTLPLYFCIAIEVDRLSLWAGTADAPARLADFPWSEVEGVEVAPVRDGSRDFWGVRLVLTAPEGSVSGSPTCLSLLLRGGGPGGIFGVSEKVAQEVSSLAEGTRLGG